LTAKPKTGAQEKKERFATDTQQAKVDMHKAARSTVGRDVVCNKFAPIIDITAAEDKRRNGASRQGRRVLRL
jgi:hypothetical protein